MLLLKILAAVIATSSFTLSLLHAAEPEAIIVTATRTAQTSDVAIAPMIVIGRNELETSPAAEISDLLRLHTGIDISRSGGPGQQTSIFIRGAESNHTLVMIDGVKINPGTIGTAAIQNIPLSMIERIEIVKGPRSTLYGSDAIGGVINIITRRATEGSHYELKAGYGSFNTQSLDFSANNKTNDYALGLSANIKDSEGYAIRTTSPVERGYDNASLHLYAEKRINDMDMKFTHLRSSGNTEYLDFFLSPVDQDFENTTTTISIENNFSANWLSKVKLSRISDEIDQNQSADFAHTSRTALDWQNDVQIEDNQLLTAGIYLSRENTRASVFGSSFDEDTDINAIFIQDDIQFEQHHLIAGARHNDHDTFGTHNTWNIDYAWQASKSLRLMAAAGTAFRSPDSTDRFGGASANPDLLPEESENKEIGIQYNISKQKNLRVNLFQNKIINLIEYDFVSGTMQNLDEALIEGAEIEYQYQTRDWSLSANAIFQDPKNTATDEQLSRRSKRKYSLAVNHHGSNYQVGFDIIHTGERDNSAYDSIVLDSYTLVNINGKYQASKRLSLNGRIENLTDEDYELAASYRTPERSYYLELVYNID